MEKYHRSPVRDYVQVKRYAGPRDFEVEQPTGEAMRRPMLPLTLSSPLPSETEIRDILRQMGKTKPEHELNCGSCGYNTCREKAVAIYQGKADSSMCLPFLKEKAGELFGPDYTKYAKRHFGTQRQPGSAADQRRSASNHESAERFRYFGRSGRSYIGSRRFSGRAPKRKEYSKSTDIFGRI